MDVDKIYIEEHPFTYSSVEMNAVACNHITIPNVNVTSN